MSLVEKERNHYFDFLRGIAILMVVGIHTYPDGHSLNGSLTDVFQLILINSLVCAVPLFLTISGYYLSKHSRVYSLLFPIGMIIIGLILGLIQMQYITSHYGLGGLRTGQKISLYIYDIGIILLCMSKKCESLYRTNLWTRIILYIGEISFGIYFTHVYLIFIADRFFPWMREHWIVLWLFSLLLTIGIIAIFKRIAPDFSRKYFGYR